MINCQKYLWWSVLPFLSDCLYHELFPGLFLRPWTYLPPLYLFFHSMNLKNLNWMKKSKRCYVFWLNTYFKWLFNVFTKKNSYLGCGACQSLPGSLLSFRGWSGKIRWNDPHTSPQIFWSHMNLPTFPLLHVGKLLWYWESIVWN